MLEFYNDILLKHLNIKAFFKSLGSAEVEITTKQLNMRKYARCEWKCMEWIGTDDWE